MSTWNRSCRAFAFALVFELAIAAGVASAQSHSHHHFSPSTGPGMGPVVGTGAGPVHSFGLFAVSGGGYSYGYGFPFYGNFGFNSVPFPYVPSFLLMPPAALAMPAGGGLLAGPMPPPALLAGPMLPPAPEAAKPRRPDPPRAVQLMTLGDRNFRAGNVHRAAERYAQAIAADPNAAAPRVRMAQIALNRSQYAEAANHYRDAIATEPGWLTHAPDIQSIYAEPADFAKQIAKLESHLHLDPHDRDAWFVLGAQWYLSGQTRKAADVFLRLTDRKVDPSLSAFLDASSPPRPAER